jgi:hypothetical protein
VLNKLVTVLRDQGLGDLGMHDAASLCGSGLKRWRDYYDVS